MRVALYVLLGFFSGSVMYSRLLPLRLCGIDIVAASDDGNPGERVHDGHPISAVTRRAVDAVESSAALKRQRALNALAAPGLVALAIRFQRVLIAAAGPLWKAIEHEFQKRCDSALAPLVAAAEQIDSRGPSINTQITVVSLISSLFAMLFYTCSLF